MYPAAGDTLANPGQIAIKVLVEDLDSAISEVIFLGDGEELGRLDRVPYVWNWVGVGEGQHVIEVMAVDAEGLAGSSAEVVVEVAHSNVAPEVDAGVDQEIESPAVGIEGRVEDDGLPAGEVSVVSWRMVSGPGSATFDSPNNAATVVRFDQEGTYVLELSASDGALSAADTVRVTYLERDTRNEPPAVDAGADQQVGFDIVRSVNLLRNPGAEQADAEGHPEHWVPAPDDDWRQGADWTPREGEAYFHAGGTTFAELSQTVTLDDYRSGIETGQQVFEFHVHTRVKEETRRDSASVRIEFLDAGGRMLNAVEVPEASVAGLWTRNALQFIPPADSHALRVVLVAENSLNDSVNDAAFDAAALHALDIPQVILDGVVTDDGLPDSGELTSKWSQVSGPAAAYFGDSSTPVTFTALFAPGIYTFELAAGDGMATASDQVVVEAVDLSGDTPPVVDAGGDFGVEQPFHTVRLAGSVEDADTPVESLEVVWSFLSGHGDVLVADPTALDSEITFSEPGSYILQLMASDGTNTVFDTVEVTVHCPADPVPLDVAVVMDVSGSMGGGKIHSASIAAHDFVHSLFPSIDRVSYIQFSGSATVVEPLGYDLDNIADIILAMTATGGSTNMQLGIEVAAEELLANQTDGRQMVMVVLTDGVSSGDVPGAAEYAKSMGIRLMTLGLGYDAAHSLLIDVASHPSQYFFISDTSVIDDVYQSLARGLCRVDAPFVSVDAGRDASGVPGVAIPLLGKWSAVRFPVGVEVEGEWSMLSGPGTVEFLQADAAVTEAVFPAPGRYLLQLTGRAVMPVTGQTLESSDVMEVTVGDSCAARVPEGMIAWWKGNGSTIEEVGGLSGNLFYHAGYIEAVSLLGFEFFGNPDKAEFPADGELSLDGAQGVTIEFWARHDKDSDGMLFEWRCADSTEGMGIRQIANGDRMAWTLPGVNGGTVTAINADYVLWNRLGVWIHWAFIHERKSGLVSLYRNGKRIATTTVDEEVDFSRLGTLIRFASENGLENHFDGVLDEVSIYRRALNGQEVDEIFTARECGKRSLDGNAPPLVDAGPDLYLQGAGVEGTLEGVASDDGLPVGGTLAYGWEQLAGPGNATFSTPDAKETQVSFNMDGTYLLQLTVSDGSAIASDTLEVRVGPVGAVEAPDGLLAWWRGNGDASEEVSGAVGYLYNGATFMDAVSLMGFEFDGSNDTVEYTEAKSIALGDAQGVTIEFWARCDQDRDSQMLDWPGNDGVPAMEVHQVGNANRMVWALPTVDGGTVTAIDKDYVFGSFGVWHHWALTFEAATGEAVLYRDGVRIAGNVVAGNIDWSQLGETLWMGSKAGVQRFLDGGIDELTIYGRALDGEEVWSIYGAGGSGKRALDGNSAPVVEAGDDWYLPDTGHAAFLQGAASDDSLPDGGTLSFSWEQVAGPGTVSWTSPEALTTEARFDLPGQYLLRLTVSDGAAVTSDTLEVRVGNACSAEPPPGMVAWWKANGNAREEWSGASGILLNGGGYSNAISLLGFEFDGSNDSMEYAEASSIALENAEGVTIEFWARCDQDRDSQMLDWPGSAGTGGMEVHQVGNANRMVWTLPTADGGTVTAIDKDYVFGRFGEWHHWALTYEAATGEAELYRDGVRITGNVVAGDIDWSQLGETLWLGAKAGVQRFLDGGIDECTIYNRALHGGEIWEVFAAGDCGKRPLDGNSAPLVDAGPDRRASQPGELLTLSATATDDGLPGNLQLTFAWEQLTGDGVAEFTTPTDMETGVSFNQEGAYLLRLTARDGAASGSDLVEVRVGEDAAAPLPADLVAWWQYDADTREELSGHSGRLLNGVGYSTAPSLMGLNFDGSNDTVEYVEAGSIALRQAQSCTIEFWARCDQDRDSQMLDWPRADGSAAMEVYQVGNADRLVWTLPTADGGTVKAIDKDYIFGSFARWLHWALVYDAATQTTRLYRDGIERGTWTLAAEVDFTALGDSIWFGAKAGVSRFLDGGLDEVSFYARALNASEIQAIHAAGSHAKQPVDTVNLPPVVIAGNKQSGTLADTFSLHGSVIDDGLPEDGTLSVAWTQTAGPPTARVDFPEYAVTPVVFTETGDYVFRLTADDGVYSVSDEVAVTVTALPNQRPVVHAGEDFTCNAFQSVVLSPQIADDGQPLDSPEVHWSVVSGPGVVAFADAALAHTSVLFHSAGSYVLRVSVDDGELVAHDEVAVEVGPRVNQPPLVDVGPDLATPFGAEVELQDSASDDGLPNGMLSFQWIKVSGPGDVGIRPDDDGSGALASFTVAGSYVMRLEVSDGERVGSDEVTVVVDPAESAAPLATVTSPSNNAMLHPDATVAVSASAFDPDGFVHRMELYANDTLLASLHGGAITCDWANPPLGVQAITAVAYDETGTAGYSEPVLVTVGYAYPSVTALQPDPGSVFADSQEFLFQVDAADTDGEVVQVDFLVDGSVAGSANSPPFAVTLGPLTEGAHTLSAVVRDNDGLSTSTPLIPVEVRAAGESGSELLLVSPIAAEVVEEPIEVVGTVRMADLLSWSLEYRERAAVCSGWTEIATGTSEVVEEVLGTFDPTLVRNGIYDIRLTASDAFGRTEAVEDFLTVDGGMKVGHFTMAFEDLTIPLAGIPITVSRVYDSRVKCDGDFGPGWFLDVSSIRLESTASVADGWQLEVVEGNLLNPSLYLLRDAVPHRLQVRMPDGRLLRFAPTLTFDQSTYGQILDADGNRIGRAFAPLYSSDRLRIVYQPMGDSEGATLVPHGYTASDPWTGTPVQVGADAAFYPESVFAGNLGLTTQENTAFDAPIIQDATGYDLVLLDGSRYSFDSDGDLFAFEDTNGNRLEYVRDGDGRITAITHSSGQGIAFHRDADGRVTSINDPNGNEIRYDYDAAGDLAAFRDRVAVADSAGPTATFDYSATIPHHLETVTDASGTPALRNEYDTEGRLVRTLDADGNETVFTHDIDGRTETITDRLGNTTVHEYDARGNVTRTVDALGQVTTMTYDADDNMLSETDPLGATTSYTYDSNGLPLTITDPLGHTTSFSYDATGRPLTMTDAGGNTTTMAYDARGNMVRMTDALGNETTMTYDARGNLLTRTDALGHTTTYTYDAFGRELTMTDALGHTTTYAYDANGNRTSETASRTDADGTVRTITTTFVHDGNDRRIGTVDALGGVTESVHDERGLVVDSYDPLDRRTVTLYDDQGRRTGTIFPDGTATSSTYDSEGHVIATTDQLGRTTTTEYDALGRVVSTTAPDGATTRTEYDAAGRVAASIDARGNRTEFEYDAAGRRTLTRDALGNETTFLHDANGNMVSATDALGRTTTHTYDALNRRTATTFPDGSTTSTTHDALGRRIATTDRNGITTTYTYDALGRLIAVTDAEDGVTSYTYDEVGNQITQTDALGRTTTYAYDDLGRRVARTLPGGQSESMTHDAVGNMLTHTDFNGATTTYSYDSMNRLLSESPDATTFPGATGATFTHTATGRRASMTDASGTTTYAYDVRDRLVEMATPRGTLTYTHDLAGNLTGIQSSNRDGTSVAYTHDVLNRLATVVDANLGTTSYSYDAVGNLATMAYPNGVTHDWRFDEANRLRTLKVMSPAAAAPLATYDYTRLPTGHRTRSAESLLLPDTTTTTRTVAYTYDNLYRLTGETITGGTPVTGATTWTHDAVGNRLTQTSGIPGVANQTHAYDANDRLAGDSYDANGNTTAATIDGVNVSDTYDYRNRLIERTTTDGKTIRITYDGDGHRVREAVTENGNTTTTEYLVDSLNPTGYAQVVEEIVQGTVTTVYSHGHDLISQDVRQPGGAFAASFHLYDGHGSVRQLTDALGTVTDAYTYDAFGVLIDSHGATTNHYLFAGEQFVPSLGLYHNRARYLNAANGRFWSMDSYEGRGMEPATLHKYLYAHGDPVNGVDPSGFLTLAESISITGVIKQMATGLGAAAFIYTVAEGVYEDIPAPNLDPASIVQTVQSQLDDALAVNLVSVYLDSTRSKTKKRGTAIIGETADRVVDAKGTTFRNAEIFAWDDDDAMRYFYRIDDSNAQFRGYGSILESANYIWIISVMRRGMHIYDIGFDVDRDDIGYFYLAELEWTRGYFNKSFFPYPGSKSLDFNE